MIGEPNWGPDGLIPVVVQDEADGRVLMVAYTDVEALAMTQATAQLHFYSRSRQTLWRKGETSGNTLRVVRLDLDCDRDAILATVRPAGPTCHRGTRSCFDLAPAGGVEVIGDDGDVEAAGGPVPGGRPALEPPAEEPPTEIPVTYPQPQGFAWLETLWSTIEDRAATRPAGSYTVSLLEGGVDAVGRKVVEEATEVLIAAKDDAAAEAVRADRSSTSAALAGETADLLYHALALLAERGQRPRSALEALRSRHAG
ncbi:MAG TPA: bifunctional phosphoribosyl-AMP cyclohydrolase/phosphoribosyl-ATP diphosphatase HisIE [Candidatus Limnocylindrales bacterium]|nr:bifunctional phosphoribosyl-AMP cyclohydrolase/phosphoribosyl-ATP diphosphatase HisIE [Candidatus Limnocylindrales bacterium]